MRHATDTPGTSRGLIAVVAVLLALGAAVAGAQEQPIVVQGRVQWIGGEKMMVIPDNGGLPIEVDITQTPLDDYRTLTENDPVIVTGVVSPDGRKVIARSVRRPGG